MSTKEILVLISVLYKVIKYAICIHCHCRFKIKCKNKTMVRATLLHFPKKRCNDVKIQQICTIKIQQICIINYVILKFNK